jgi:hypothetical protein
MVSIHSRLSTLNHQQRVVFLLENLISRQVQREAGSSLVPERLHKIMEEYERRLSLSTRSDPCVAFVRLISALRTQNVDPKPSLRLILSMLRNDYPKATYDSFIVKMLRHHRSKSSPPLPLEVLHEEISKLAELSPRRALYLLIQQNNLRNPRQKLSQDAFFELLTSFVSGPRSFTHRETIKFLASQPDIYIPDVPHTKSPTDVPLNPRHVQLVHDFAMAIASAPNTNARQAFRGVMLCYRYLHTRGGAGVIGPDMSRAMAMAGLMRNAEERKWISSTKLVFILDWVCRLQGEQEARILDEACFVWRGKMIEDGIVQGGRPDLGRTRSEYRWKSVAESQDAQHA